MAWWRDKQKEEQLDKELRFHIEQHTADLIARGHPPEQALREARLAFGGPTQVKEECRDARGTRWLEDLWQDLRYTLRTLRQRPGFAAVALCTLALGIGATTVMFTVVNGVVLKPLSYPEPERLVTIQEQTEKATQLGSLWALAYPNFLDCSRQSHSLTMAAWTWGGGVVTKRGQAEYVDGRQISSQLFSVLGVPLLVGRTFLPEEDQPGGAPVAIIGNGLWQRLFGGSPAAIGSPLVLEGKSYTIVGVAPAAFQLSGPAEVFTPLGQNTELRMQARAAHFLSSIARLAPRVTLDVARAELSVIGGRLAAQYPDTNAARGFTAQPLQQELIADVRSTLWLLLGAASLVLSIACVNVASLLLARAVSRDRELAMRAALGAGRGRLIRQCLTESAVLGISGGALGILVASLGIHPFVRLWPGDLPRAAEVQLDWRVLLFALAVSVTSGFLFGLAPALRAPGRELEMTLRIAARSVTGSVRALHSSFVICEIALAVVLLVSAGILGRTLLRLWSLNPGVEIRNVLVTRAAISPGALTNPARTRASWQDFLEHASRVPGVQWAALVDTVPMREGVNEIGYWTTPAEPAPNDVAIALATSVTPDYLKVMGIPLRYGRFFDSRDRLGSTVALVIDEVMAQRVFGGRDAIGKRLWVAGLGPGAVQVVGVVGHVRHWGLAADDGSKVRDQIYYSLAQLQDKFLPRWSELMSLAVRTSVDPLNVIEPLRREVRGANGDQVLYEPRTMQQLASASVAQQRFLMMLFGVFSGLALLLACIGIYGVLAYTTRQRVPEIGLRMALGATARDVMRLVFRQSLRMIILGVSIGLATALAAAHLLERLVAGVRSTEPLTFAIMITVLVAAALFASFVPALRASRVDPISALRQE